jgi:hypothetical protein
MFLMNKYNDSETGVSPYTLIFGSDSVRHFAPPTGELNRSTASSFLKALDDDLAVVKAHSLKFQSELVRKRADFSETHNTFQKGDFVLFEHPKEKPLPSKLGGKYAGPFEVLSHVKNDVSCRHCATGKVSEFFVGSLKLFMGTKDEAERLAMADADQYKVDAFLAYKGDPLHRMSMEFLVRFADKQEIWLPWSEDLFATVQYEEFVRMIPPLFPLLHRTLVIKHEITSLNRSPIKAIRTGDELLMDIRCYGADWYEALPISDRHTRTYVAKHLVGALSASRLKIDISCPLLKRELTVNHLFVKQYAMGVRSITTPVEIDSAFVSLYPSLLNQEVKEKGIADYKYLLGKTYIDDEDNRKYEVVKIFVNPNRFIVASVKHIRQPYSKSKLMDTPLHIADVERMFIASSPL